MLLNQFQFDCVAMMQQPLDLHSAGVDFQFSPLFICPSGIFACVALFRYNEHLRDAYHPARRRRQFLPLCKLLFCINYTHKAASNFCDLCVC